MKTRVLMVSPWASREGGGLQFSVCHLAHALGGPGYTDVSFVSVEDRSSAEDSKLWGNIPVKLHPYYGTTRFRFSPSLVQDLLSRSVDIIQLHGIWMFPSLAVRISGRKLRVPLVISPHGMMDPWIMSRGRIQKSIALLLFERRNWNVAAAFRALNTAEADAIRLLSPKARIEVIPNGVHCPAANLVEHWSTARQQSPRRFLFLGRLHEKKCVLELVEAWRRFETDPASTDSTLTIAGWGDSEYVRKVEAALSSTHRAEFVGAKFGAEKEILLRQASYFILPSRSEGLPVAVLEACAHGLVPIISEQCNLPDLFERHLAVRVDSSVPSIYNGLVKAVTERANASGADARNYVESAYSWQRIALQFRELHLSLLR